MKNIIEKYRSTGFKLTPQRIAILKILDGNTTHPTAEEIYNELKKTCPTASFATVYNTVQALTERGELVEITIDPERKHFDPNPAPHHHIRCIECNRISDIFVDYASELELPDEVREEFTVVGNHVDFLGVCNECSCGNDENEGIASPDARGH